MPFNGLNADHIAGALEPQRVNNFVVTMGVGTTLIQKALSSFTLPKESNPPVVVPYGNEERKVAGAARYEQVTMELTDYIDSPVMQTIMAWREKVYNPKNGVIGYALQYKSQGYASLLGPDGAVSRRWRLMGIFPREVNPGGGDMSSNTVNMVTVTFRVDKAIEEV